MPGSGSQPSKLTGSSLANSRSTLPSSRTPFLARLSEVTARGQCPGRCPRGCRVGPLVGWCCWAVRKLLLTALGSQSSMPKPTRAPRASGTRSRQTCPRGGAVTANARSFDTANAAVGTAALANAGQMFFLLCRSWSYPGVDAGTSSSLNG